MCIEYLFVKQTKKKSMCIKVKFKIAIEPGDIKYIYFTENNKCMGNGSCHTQKIPNST